jgi:hypothetical protein
VIDFPSLLEPAPLDRIAVVTPRVTYRQLVEGYPRDIENAWDLFREDLREQIRGIVNWGLSDVRAWLGEIDPDDAACDCAPPFSPVAHSVGDHRGDCWSAPPCGGCYRCMSLQYHFYEEQP